VVRYSSQGYKWEPLRLQGHALSADLRAAAALAEEILSWEGTPYMHGQQVKKVGVDCVRFVCSVLDNLQTTQTNFATLPQDAAMHSRGGAIRSMLNIKRRFQARTVRDHSMQPGDIVVVGPPNGGPGHALIVGFRPNTLWHAANPAVHQTGIGFIVGEQKVFRVYRLLNRHLWGLSCN